jgi:hypothetical protein
MDSGVAAGRELLVGGILVLLSAPLIPLTRRLVVIRPRLILVARSLVLVCHGLVLFRQGLIESDRPRLAVDSRDTVGKELCATGRTTVDLSHHTAGWIRHSRRHHVPPLRQATLSVQGAYRRNLGSAIPPAAIASGHAPVRSLWFAAISRSRRPGRPLASTAWFQNGKEGVDHAQPGPACRSCRIRHHADNTYATQAVPAAIGS